MVIIAVVIYRVVIYKSCKTLSGNASGNNVRSGNVW
jgi:hypothetical protein